MNLEICNVDIRVWNTREQNDSMGKWFLQKGYKTSTPCILFLDGLPGKFTKHDIDKEFVYI